jgi:hypothetical protein
MSVVGTCVVAWAKDGRSVNALPTTTPKIADDDGLMLGLRWGRQRSARALGREAQSTYAGRAVQSATGPLASHGENVFSAAADWASVSGARSHEVERRRTK